MMEGLKSSLTKKLTEFGVGRNDWETLGESTSSEISIKQCEAVENWHQNCVKNEFDRKVFSFENQPFTLTKTKPSLVEASNENSEHEDEETYEDFKSLALKTQRVIRRQAIKQLFQKRDMLCLHPIELGVLGALLCKNSENFNPQNNTLMSVEDYVISFPGYQTAIKEFSEYIRNQREVHIPGFKWLMADSLWIMKWFTAKLFMKLSRSELGGKVPTSSLMQYVHKKVYNYQLRLDFLDYDADGRGYITKNQLTLYLSRNCPWNFDELDEIQTLERQLYIDYVVSEIFFLLDPYKKMCVRIDELLGWRLIPFVRKDFQDGSQFNDFSFRRIVYQELVEMNDQLSISTFCRNFPEVAQHIWQNDIRLGNKKVRFLESSIKRLLWNQTGVSYETFLDITFAWENLHHSFSSIWYFFRALDVDYKGYLEIEDLEYHYQALQEYWKQMQGSGRYNDIANNLIQIQLRKEQINDLVQREGVSRITPEILHKIPDGYMIIEYLLNPEAVSSSPSSLPQMKKST